jgi:4-hydroxy-tetrahydrodipicolinate synthase
VVASGTFGGPIEAQAAFVKQMAEIVEAVVVLVCQMAEEGVEDAGWRANTQQLLDLTGDVPLGLYECTHSVSPTVSSHSLYTIHSAHSTPARPVARCTVE